METLFALQLGRVSPGSHATFWLDLGTYGHIQRTSTDLTLSLMYGDNARGDGYAPDL